jgi:hypothetical protein
MSGQSRRSSSIRFDDFGADDTAAGEEKSSHVAPIVSMKMQRTTMNTMTRPAVKTRSTLMIR